MATEERVILHADMNNFYASVECMLNPKLRGHPVAVGGDVEARHGIILAKNYEAKAYGIQTGEALWQAKQKCKDLIIVPPHYEEYLKYSRLARSIYEEYTDRIQPYGMDENWLDVTAAPVSSVMVKPSPTHCVRESSLNWVLPSLWGSLSI